MVMLPGACNGFRCAGGQTSVLSVLYVIHVRHRTLGCEIIGKDISHEHEHFPSFSKRPPQHAHGRVGLDQAQNLALETKLLVPV